MYFSHIHLPPTVQTKSSNTIHCGESRDLNDRVHGISCRYLDKRSKQTYHIFLNTQPIFINQRAHSSNYSKRMFISKLLYNMH